MNKGTTFSPGKHSFYGMMRIYVESGQPIVNGALLSPGFCDNVFAPIYGLPITFECSSNFSMSITSISRDILAEGEIKYYFPEYAPDGFKEIASGVFYSQSVHGAEYNNALINFVGNTLKKAPTKIFVAGGKGVGKSTLSTHIINSAISSHGRVGLLDIDPGQPLLSVPGSLSFTVLDRFILGPPERYSNLAQTIYFYGSVSVTDNIPLFYNCIEELSKIIPKDIFVVINSFGWVEDLGLTLHQKILDTLQPENVIMLTKPGEAPSPIRGYMFRSEVIPKAGYKQITPKVQRVLRIVALFTGESGPISYQQPYQFSLSDIHISFACVDVEPTECLTALNGSIVALGCDQRKFKTNKTLVTLLKSPAVIPCVGFGIVRAVDKENATIYVISKVDSESISSVNTIIMGSVQTPIDLYLDTPRADPNYLGIGLMQKAGASTEPLTLKQTPVFE